MSIDITDIIRVAVTGTAPQASVWQHVWHYYAHSGTTATETDVLTGVSGNYTTAWANMVSYISDQYSVGQVEGWKYNTVTNKWEGFGTLTFGPLTGGSASDPHPHGVAAVGRWSTDIARRQGRHFLPGIIDSAIDLGLIDSAVVTAFIAYLDDWTDDVVVTGLNLNLCTFNTDITSVYYETKSDFSGTLIVSNIPGYQRRRKPLVGI